MPKCERGFKSITFREFMSTHGSMHWIVLAHFKLRIFKLVGAVTNLFIASFQAHVLVLRDGEIPLSAFFNGIIKLTFPHIHSAVSLTLNIKRKSS